VRPIPLLPILVIALLLRGCLNLPAASTSDNTRPSKPQRSAQALRLLDEAQARRTNRALDAKQIGPDGFFLLEQGVLELMHSEKFWDRIIAEHVLRWLSRRHCGLQEDGTWPSSDALQNWETLWQTNGAYHHASALPECIASHWKWTKWVEATKDKRITHLIATFNDKPDILHGDYTQASSELMGMGLDGLRKGVLKLLLSEDAITRMRAAKVVELVSMKELGYVDTMGWLGTHSVDEWRQLWKSNGDYHFDASPENRLASYQKWQAWLVKLEIKDLVANISEGPFHLHSDYTANVCRLNLIGPKVLDQGLLELLLSENSTTRLHAKTVLVNVAYTQLGMRPDLAAEEARNVTREFQKIWKLNGDYNERATEKERRSSYEKWSVWWQEAKLQDVKP
jgi:hypothetical protein